MPIVKYEEVIFLVASFFLQKIIRVVVLVPRPLDLGHYLVVCFLLQKIIKTVVLVPWPEEEEDGGLGLDVIWYKKHQQGRR